MFLNTYWHLTSRAKKSVEEVIVELMPDGTAYVWPMKATILDPKRPPEMEQDPDGLLTDGDFLECTGFYHSIADFMDHSLFTRELYDASPIGELESIRSCRAVMAKTPA